MAYTKRNRVPIRKAVDIIDFLRGAIESVDGKLRYKESLTDKKVAEKFGVHVASVARLRREAVGELESGHGMRNLLKAAKMMPEQIEMLAAAINALSRRVETLETMSVHVQTGQPVVPFIPRNGGVDVAGDAAGK